MLSDALRSDSFLVTKDPLDLNRIVALASFYYRHKAINEVHKLLNSLFIAGPDGVRAKTP